MFKRIFMIIVVLFFINITAGCNAVKNEEKAVDNSSYGGLIKITDEMLSVQINYYEGVKKANNVKDFIPVLEKFSNEMNRLNARTQEFCNNHPVISKSETPPDEMNKIMRKFESKWGKQEESYVDQLNKIDKFMKDPEVIKVIKEVMPELLEE